MLKHYYNRSLNTPHHCLLGLLTGQASVCYSDASIAMLRASKHLSTSTLVKPSLYLAVIVMALPRRQNQQPGRHEFMRRPVACTVPFTANVCHIVYHRMVVYMTVSGPTPHALLCARRLNIPGASLLDLRDAYKDRC